MLVAPRYEIWGVNLHNSSKRPWRMEDCVIWLSIHYQLCEKPQFKIAIQRPIAEVILDLVPWRTRLPSLNTLLQNPPRITKKNGTNWDFRLIWTRFWIYKFSQPVVMELRYKIQEREWYDTRYVPWYVHCATTTIREKIWTRTEECGKRNFVGETMSPNS